jgi:hypothetical protein
MSKFNEIVQILLSEEERLQEYFNHVIFIPYEISEIDFNNFGNHTDDIKRLFYFSLTTRQRGANNHHIEWDDNTAENPVLRALTILNDNTIEISKRYFGCLKELSQFQGQGVGQKIITMFVKFVVFHSQNLTDVEAIKKYLWIPLDIHMVRFLFTRIYKEREGYVDTNRFNLIEEEVNTASLKVKINDNYEPKENRLYQLQKKIKDLFNENGLGDITPIILDYLWVIGSTKCNNTSVSLNISCNICPFNVTFTNNDGIDENICLRNGVN